jgi:hypothetical protein
MLSFENGIIEDSQIAILAGVDLTEEEIEASSQAYEAHRGNVDNGILLGVFGPELRNAMADPSTVMIYDHQNDSYSPLLVPTSDLEWYNMPYLTGRYGEDTPLYCYVHPEIPYDEATRAVVANAIKDILDIGAVILYDQYEDVSPFEDDQWSHEEDPQGQTKELLVKDGEAYELESLGSRRIPKKDDVFIGMINFDGTEEVKEVSSIYDTYKAAVESGSLLVDRENGAIIEDVMSEGDVERVWQIYKRPFERLSKGHPMLAGFDEETLKTTLREPSIVKLVNRSEGDITTVGIFTQNFEHCPWFNAQYYKENYPEYFETNNILLCPGIVSDEERRGHTYSWSLVDLMIKSQAERGSNLLLSFECTEISTRYIPEKVVVRGVESSGLAVAEGFDAPASTIVYKALRKAVTEQSHVEELTQAA